MWLLPPGRFCSYLACVTEKQKGCEVRIERIQKAKRMGRGGISALLALLLPMLVPAPSEGRVVRFIVERTRLIAEGSSFAAVGPYERLDGTVYIELDPLDPRNGVIVNLDKAPRMPNGNVGFSSPFFILKPVDLARGNRKIFYGLNNRGNKLDYAWRTVLPPTGTNNNNPLTAADFGDAFLLRLGYAYVDAGWQANVVPGEGRLVPNFPVAGEPDGRPIVARTRVEFNGRLESNDFTRPLTSGPQFRAYETADLNTANSALTVRQTVNGLKTPIPSNQWAFGRCHTGQATLVPTTTDVCLYDGFKSNRIYELVYPAKNPWVMGLGYVVTRDLVSFLRYELRDDAGNRNPLALGPSEVGLRQAYGSGISSSGMYMRDFLYLGFNEDEARRKVFDAVQIVVAGTHRLLANVEFADPNTYSRQDIWHDSLSYSYPPLTFAVTTDPISGIRDGILKRPATDPLVFQVDSATEFWQMNASLNVHDGHGRPVPIPNTVRLYFASSFHHVGVAGLLSPAQPAGICRHQIQGNGWSPTLRALLVALDEWADRGIDPPASNYPRVEDQTLVALDAAREMFPMIPGVKFPSVINELALPDFGPAFESTGGRLSQLPPKLGTPYQLFVPKPDSDGLDVAGIRSVEVTAPIATVTGWNLRAPGHQEGDLCGNSGSFIPFATTKGQQQMSGDPRLSLEERYARRGFASAVEEATRRLVQERFLLQEDADRYIEAARERNLLRSGPNSGR